MNLTRHRGCFPVVFCSCLTERRLAVRPQKCLVDYETSPDFPLSWGWVDNDYIFLLFFLHWTVSLRKAWRFCLFFPPKAAASMEQKTIVKIRNIGKSVVISSDHYHAFSFNLYFSRSFLQSCSSLHCGHYKGVMKPIKTFSYSLHKQSRKGKLVTWADTFSFCSLLKCISSISISGFCKGMIALFLWSNYTLNGLIPSHSWFWDWLWAEFSDAGWFHQRWCASACSGLWALALYPSLIGQISLWICHPSSWMTAPLAN